MATTSARVEGFTLRALQGYQVAALQRMIGRTCLYRDTYGRRIFGAFTVVNIQHIPLTSPVLADVQIQFQQISFDEAV